jgi:hypothetical protein
MVKSICAAKVQQKIDIRKFICKIYENLHKIAGKGLAGGAAFSIRQDWTDTRENAGREVE